MAADDIEAKLEELREPPVLPKTRADHWRHAVGYIGLVTGTAALVVAIGVGVRGSQTADCINSNQGARNQPNVNDRIATDTLFSQQAEAMKEVTTDPGKTIADISQAFVAYKATRDADDRARADNPIGKC